MSQNIIITGASSGIGRATAELLLEQGKNVVACSRRSEKLDDLTAKYPKSFVNTTGDVRDYDFMASVIRACKDKFGSIDGLVNNAGLGYFDPLDEGKIEQWKTMVDVNITGLLNGIHCAIPALTESKGHIVNIGSVASHNVFPRSGVYCATKHAVRAISESIRLDLTGKVRVTTISPGAVNTEFIDHTTNSEIHKQLRPQFDDGLSSNDIASQIAWAINSPANTSISEIIIRPNKQHNA